MFRTRLDATVDTDLDAKMQLIRSQCAAHIQEPELAAVLNQIRLILNDLIDRGRELASTGSSMDVLRKVSGEGYEIEVYFSTRKKSGLLSKLFDIVRR